MIYHKVVRQLLRDMDRLEKWVDRKPNNFNKGRDKVLYSQYELGAD